MPELDALGIHELEGQPGVEHWDEHGGDDDAGGHPADELPTAPLLHGAGIAEQQHARIEIIGGGVIALHQRPGGLVGGVDGVGQQQRGHGIDQALQLAVGPDIGAVFLGLLTGVEPAYNDKCPARGDIKHSG